MWGGEARGEAFREYRNGRSIGGDGRGKKGTVVRGMDVPSNVRSGSTPLWLWNWILLTCS